MQRLGTVCSLLALGAMMSLTGCGSSGSDTGGENPGSQVPPPPVASGGDTISISGKVTDMPIANATVTVTVGGQTFTADAPTDAEGNYTVEISSDDPNAIVVLEATDSTGVHFTAVLDDFGGFEAKADSDGNVADTDITNVTTAHYLLATNASDDGSIDDADELDEVAGRIDPAAVLQLSAAIKLVVENIEGVALPDGVDNTQQLAAAILNGTSTFLDDVAATAPGALDTAMDLVVNDGNATHDWDLDEAPGVYLHRNGASIYTLYADGMGQAASFEYDEVIDFQWSIDSDGKLHVAYMDNSGSQDSVTILSQHRNMLTVMVEEQSASGEVVAQEPTTVAYYPFADGFTNDNAAGTYSTLGEPGHVKVLLADHTGYDLNLVTGVQSDFFTWEVDANGTMHLVDSTGLLQNKARVLAENDDDGMMLLVSEYDAQGMVTHLDVISVRRADETAGSPGELVDLDLHLAGNTYAWFDDNEISLFRFRADGALRQISQTADGDLVDFEQRLGEWMLVDVNTIRTWFPGNEGHEDATVVDGLGDEYMTVQTGNDAANGTESVAKRIMPIEISDVAGAYYFTDEAGSIQSEFVMMNTDFTGELWVNGVLDKSFDWAIDEHGSLIISLHSEQDFANETLTLHMLAGSDVGGNMHFVMVRRLNGLLHAGEASGRALRVIHIWREG